MEVYSSIHISLRNVLINALVELCQQINSNRLAMAKGWNLKSAKPSLTPKSILQTTYFAALYSPTKSTNTVWLKTNLARKIYYIIWEKGKKRGKKASSSPHTQTFHRRENKTKSKQAELQQKTAQRLKKSAGENLLIPVLTHSWECSLVSWN